MSSQTPPSKPTTAKSPPAKPPAAQRQAAKPAPIQHPGEDRSNDLRRRAAIVEPAALRTYTPSLAVIARAEGSYLWTPEERRLADFTSGVLVANLGHNPANWWRRVLGYMQLGNVPPGDGFFSAQPLTAYNALTELEIRAAERLVAVLRRQPGGARMEQVVWAASGSEAVQKAIWAALSRRPGSDQILATRFGFHGKKGLACAVTGSESDAERDPRVHFISFPREECIDVARRRQPIDLEPYAAELSALWQQHGNRIAALITEPYLGGAGSYHPQPAYLQLLERFCREHDVVFILDEVQANFGRTGELFAFSHYGLEPDVVVLGKGLGNGVAVDAAVGRAELFAGLHYGEVSDTWSGGPLGCAAVLATLDEFESGAVLEHAQKLAVVLEKGLCRLAELDVVAHVRGEGVVWGIECAAVGNHSAAEVASACVAACYLGDSRGRAIHLLGPLASKVIRVSPPLVMPLDEAKDYLDAMFGIFERVQKDLA
ncbi:MAG TPA: aspartate aminotransferase family protein [Pirellulales bacterium]|jgi:4-aminobutyrate aminotransferase-like enzyme|nr:aspartate aminotransferase family protein [Pirellulales bacterium]